MNEKLKKLTVGFAAGVMMAASVWSLILPAVEMAEEQGVIPWVPAAVRNSSRSSILTCNQ